MTWNIIVLVVFILIVLGLGYILFKGAWEDRKLFVNAYKQMKPFQQASLKVGLAYYFVIPLLKEHPSKDSYIALLSIDILSALANALFILGAIAFLEKGHELYIKKEKS